MRVLSLTSKNIIEGTGNSQLSYSFPSGAINIEEGDQLALSSVSMYNSVFNITSALNNNTFAYTWIDNSEKIVSIPDGFYDVDGINDFLHQTMLNNGHYLIENATGNFVWFITIQVNVSIYAIEISCFPMNTTKYPIGTGGTQYTLPTFTGTMVAWTPQTANITPFIEIAVGSGLESTLGFKGGFYAGRQLGGTGPPVYTLKNTITPSGSIGGTQLSTYSTIQTLTSQSTPQITSLTSYLMTCSLINNNFTIPNTLLSAFPPSSAFAEQFVFSPNQMSFIDCQVGSYSSFNITLYDQNLRNIVMQDNQIVVLLVIKKKNERS
jgi:hypothetical protein